MNNNPQEYNQIGQVEDWKKLTMMTGKLNPVQLENIKMYPFTVIEKPYPHDLNVKVEYDLKVDFKDDKGASSPGFVCYNIESSEEISYDHSMLCMVKEALRTLFWTNLKIHFLYNGDRFWSSEDE